MTVKRTPTDKRHKLPKKPVHVISFGSMSVEEAGAHLDAARSSPIKTRRDQKGQPLTDGEFFDAITPPAYASAPTDAPPVAQTRSAAYMNASARSSASLLPEMLLIAFISVSYSGAVGQRHRQADRLMQRSLSSAARDPHDRERGSGGARRRFFDAVSRLGRPSIPPERLLRAMLLQAFYSIRSERQLMERMDFDLLFRWFVGIGVDDAACTSCHPIFAPGRRTQVSRDMAESAERDAEHGGDLSDAREGEQRDLAVCQTAGNLSRPSRPRKCGRLSHPPSSWKKVR